jgi:hypothetical protein
MFKSLRKRATSLYQRYAFVRNVADFLAFYGAKVIPRAFKDTVSFVARNLWKEVLIAILLVIAALATGEEETRTADLEASLVLLLIIAGVSAVALFVLQFFMAPVKFKREHDEQVKTLHAQFFVALTKRKVLFSTQKDVSRAALPIASELKEVRRMADMMIEASAATPYRDGFQFPRSRWVSHGYELAPDKELYAAVEKAYAETHRANEIIAWRETQKTTRLHGVGPDDDLGSVRAAADDAIAALNKAIIVEDLG